VEIRNTLNCIGKGLFVDAGIIGSDPFTNFAVVDGCKFYIHG
jgi:hypothetical protein